MFDTRANATEFLDEPDCDPALAAASYQFMKTVNHRFGGIRTVQRYLATISERHHESRPLRILDIGSGSCDIPLAISQWAKSKRIPMHFTCLEMADHAARIARTAIAHAGDPAVHFLQENIFTHQPAVPYDYATASMCFHHFSDAQILALLQRLRGFVVNGMLINDLRRSQWAHVAANLLMVATRAPVGVRHDALLSIRRGFKINDLRTLLQQLDNTTFSVKPARWFRIAAIIQYNRGNIL